MCQLLMAVVVVIFWL